ncbi:MAG: hypothetical protein LUQ68_06790 [Methylococcaceae bacterium]|jgi:hypothetical protein|nr:hypothetical protein [Methylococcaceae bacterium]
MIAVTAVVDKPNTSRVIKSSLYLKLPIGGLVIAFFEPCPADRVLGLRSGLVSDLTFTGSRSGVASGFTFTGLRSELALGLAFTGSRSELASDLTFTGLRSELALGLTFTGLRGVTGLFILALEKL